MWSPVNEQDALEMVHNGNAMYGMTRTEGFVKVFEPVLQDMLKKANAKCHDLKLKQSGEHAIVEHNTLKKVLAICGEHIENMKTAIDYCKENNINFR